jgi:hypothetical protein
MNLRQYQQGDVNITELTQEQFNDLWPKTWDGTKKPIEKLDQVEIIRQGSSAGNSHKLCGGLAIRVTGGFRTAGQFITEIKTEAYLKHEEHKAILIPAGYWLFSPVFEFDALRNKDTFVID